MSEDLKANSKKLLDLLETNKGVLMPIYQRDYAQGRESASMIREDLIRELFEAINNDEIKELNFVYGGEKERTDESGAKTSFFIPIDGQQRLTTLFLFHWYIFIRADASETEKECLRRFLYSTRTTTEKFCNGIINMTIPKKKSKNVVDFSVAPRMNTNKIPTDSIDISFQIKEQPWFTGNMSNDPTVASMLVTIEEIHKYASLNSVENFSKLKDDLINKSNLVFLCLDMKEELGDETAIRDLYVKMNARGKLLTDFENLKSLLQKEPEKGKIDFIGEYIKTCADNQVLARRDVIGYFNNNFTNFFFNIVDDGKIIDNSDDASCDVTEKQGFDIAIMKFVIEYLRMAFILCVDDSGISSDKYRAYIYPEEAVSGREFYRFITSAGEEYIQKIFDEKSENEKQKAINNMPLCLNASFNKMVDLLKLLSDNEKYILDNVKTNYWLKSVRQLIREYLNVSDKNNTKNMIARLSIFEFFSSCGISDELTECFEVWCRFIFKVLSNSEFEHTDDAVKAYKKFKEIINSINKDISVEKLFDKISKIDTTVGYASIKNQVEEEVIKATLCLKDNEWYSRLREAEDYFQDGHIWFLLQYAQNEGNYDKNKFDNMFEFCKQYLDPSKRLKNTINKNLFENALFAINSNRNDINQTHMAIPDNSSAKMFLLGNLEPLLSIKSRHPKHYGKQEILLNLIEKLIGVVDVEVELKKIIDSVDINSFPAWQKIFIEDSNLYNLKIGNESFRKCIHITDEGDVLLIVRGTNTRAASFDLDTYLLYLEILSKKLENITISFNLASSEKMIEDSLPRRYMLINDIKVGCYNKEFYVWENDKNDCTKVERNKVIPLLENML